jgi:hypothetical protein
MKYRRYTFINEKKRRRITKRIMNNAEKQQHRIVTEWNHYHAYATEILELETIIAKKKMRERERERRMRRNNNG